MDNLTIYDSQTFEEIKKCQESPYYFATNYLIVDGRRFSTTLNEKEFNAICKSKISGKHKFIGKRR